MADTCVVACKVPNGLVLRLFEPQVRSEPVMGGGARDVTTYQPTGDQVTVKGPATPIDKRPAAQIEGGYALTFGVPADFMAKWMAANQQTALVREKLIFVSATTERAAKQAVEQEGIRSGLEPLDPNNLPKAQPGVVSASPPS